MPIQIIEAPRLYRQIADHLRDLILRKEFAPGSRLPTERELAIKIGVSRPSVREALIALEVEGWIEIRKGSGIYVARRSPELRLRPEHARDAPGPFELLRARAVIEGEVAALAARKAKKRDLKELDAVLEEMHDEARTCGSALQADRMFHVRMAQIAGNGVLLALVIEMFDHRSGPMSTRLGLHLEGMKAWYAAIEEHRHVILALSIKDEAAARAAMQRHMDRSHRRLSVRLD